MFSFFFVSKEHVQLTLQDQVTFIVEQSLLYESRHAVTADLWRRFGQLHHELYVQYEFHRSQQQLLRTFHEAEARKVYERMQRIVQLFECYKLVKAQQLAGLDERLRLERQRFELVYEQFVLRREQRYSEETDHAFFTAIYDEMMPIIANINERYL